MAVKRTRWRYVRFFRALLPSLGVLAATRFVSIYLTLDSLVMSFGGVGNNLGRNLSAPVVVAFTVGTKMTPYLCPLVLAGLWQGPAGLARGHYPWLLKAHGLSAQRSALLLFAACLIDALSLWACVCVFSSLISALFQASFNPSLLRSAFGISPGQIGLWSIATMLPSVSLALSTAGLWVAACLVCGSGGLAFAASLVVYLEGCYLLPAVSNLSFISRVDGLRPGAIVLALLILFAAAGAYAPSSKRRIVFAALALVGGLAGFALFGDFALWGTDAASVAVVYAIPAICLDGISRGHHAFGGSRERVAAGLVTFAIAAVALLLPLSIRRWYMAALLAIPGVLVARLSGRGENGPTQAFSPFPPLLAAVGLCALGASAPILTSALRRTSPGPVEASIAYGVIAVAVITLVVAISGALGGGGVSRLLPSLAIALAGSCLVWLWILFREAPLGVAIAQRACLGGVLAVVGVLAAVRLVRLYKRRARLAGLSMRELWREVGAKTGLTEGEIEAVLLLGRGYNVPYVARSLSLSPAAVASRRTSAYKKLGIHRRNELSGVLLGLLGE